MNFITEVLRSYGFEYVDYVYEPGQYAVRGSIIDVFSFSSEFPYRIDFFGDEVESIRTFEVETQLSKEKKEALSIVPRFKPLVWSRGNVTGMVSFGFSIGRIPCWQCVISFGCVNVFRRCTMKRLPTGYCRPRSRRKWLYYLEGKLIDGGEFTLRALDFRRMEFGNEADRTPDATLLLIPSAQPIFHKNFDLVAESFKEYMEKGIPFIYVVTA